MEWFISIVYMNVCCQEAVVQAMNWADLIVTWTRSTIAILSKDSDNAEDDSQARSTPNLLININTLY